MSDVGLGLIGCGGRLRGVLKNTLEYSDKLKVIGAYDIEKVSIDKTKEMFDPELKVFGSGKELVSSPEVDWVMIASWNNSHREHTVAAFEAGKDVFCEKPLATTLEDCVAMRDAWKKSGKKFVIGFTLRYSAHYEKIKELIDAGSVGYIVSMEFNETLGFNHGGYIHGDWRRLTKYAGTHLLEKCCHDIDLANWILGSKARRVASFGGLNFFTPENEKHIERLGKDDKGNDAYQTWPGLVKENPFTADKDIIDNQVAIIEYENNIRATFHSNCNAAIPERRMYILGSEGAIRADVLTGEIQLKRIGFKDEIQDIDSGVKGGHGGGDSVLGESLAKCMLNGHQPHTSLDDGLTSAITCFGIDEAMKTGKVVDMKPWWEKVGLA